MTTGPISQFKTAQVVLVFLAATALIGIASLYLPPGIDWHSTYRPASLALLSGKSPYGVEVSPTAPFFAAPWGLVPLVPFALLPESLGRSGLFFVSIIVFAFAARRLGAGPLALVAFLLSPPVMHCLLNANIEWMPVLGFVLPPQWGVLLVTIKPQVGSAVIVYWLVEAWRRGGLGEVARVFGPVSLVALLSFGLFGFWPMHFRDILPLAAGFNASLWPSSIPVGLALVVASIRTRQIRYAMGASPCLSPYVLFHGWSGALMALAPLDVEMITAVIGLWVLVAIRGLSGGL